MESTLWISLFYIPPCFRIRLLILVSFSLYLCRLPFSNDTVVFALAPEFALFYASFGCLFVVSVCTVDFFLPVCVVLVFQRFYAAAVAGTLRAPYLKEIFYLVTGFVFFDLFCFVVWLAHRSAHSSPVPLTVPVIWLVVPIGDLQHSYLLRGLCPLLSCLLPAAAGSFDAGARKQTFPVPAELLRLCLSLLFVM